MRYSIALVHGQRAAAVAAYVLRVVAAADDVGKPGEQAAEEATYNNCSATVY